MGKLPNSISLRIFLGGCPHCGREVQDKRYKRRSVGFATHIYRISQTSVTMECKNCKLRFCVTWNNLVKLMCRQFDDLIKNIPKEPKERKFHLQWLAGLDRQIKLLDSHFDTFYSRRKPPTKQFKKGVYL